MTRASRKEPTMTDLATTIRPLLAENAAGYLSAADVVSELCEIVYAEDDPCDIHCGPDRDSAECGKATGTYPCPVDDQR